MSNSKDGHVTGMVCTKKALASGFFTVFFWGYGIYFLLSYETVGAAVFAILGVLFFREFLKSARNVSISRKGVESSFFGLKKRFLSWEQIAEMGLIGEKVFSKKENKTGDKYMYFATHKRTADERFQMIVAWPPVDDTIYVEYTAQLMEKAQFFYKHQFETYNVRDLYPNSAEPTSKKPLH